MKYLEDFDNYSHICPPRNYNRKYRLEKEKEELQSDIEEAERDKEEYLRQEKERKSKSSK